MLKEPSKAIANCPDIVGRTSRDLAQGIGVVPFAFRTGIRAGNHTPGLAIPVFDQRSIIGAGGSAGDGPGDPDIIAGQREDTRESVSYIPRIRAGHNLPERASRLMSRRSVAGREQRASNQHEKNHGHAGDAGMAHRILFLSWGIGWREAGYELRETNVFILNTPRKVEISRRKKEPGMPCCQQDFPLTFL